MTYVYEILIMKPDRNRTLGRPRHRLENSIKLYLSLCGLVSYYSE